MPSRGIVGGRLVAKILVADDNSNIQKMVGLALKDQGIDVVAVGNGEAAVRKISDLRPDLVLADVFMPVRNGYEVCQYVKRDASLSHIPVILLVGAFDPLDEQEAQRVGADGVLKKPFVPPDPLISMVKSALQRAGVAHGIAGAAKAPPEPAPLKVADLLGPSSASLPTLGSVRVHTPKHEEPVATLENESFVDEVPARPDPVRIDTGAQPVAFGSLLETPAEETEEEDAAYLSPVNSELAMERDWRDPDLAEAEEEQEEEKPAGTWRHDETESDDGSRGGAKDWRAGSFEQIQARKTRVEDWEPVEEKTVPVDPAPVASASVKEVPVVSAGVPEDTTVISATPFAKDAWAATVSRASQEEASTETATALQEVARTKERERPSAEAAASSAAEVKEAEPEKKASKDSWFSVASNPWDAEIEKANRLASAWDAAVPAPSAASNGTEKAAEAVGEETKAGIKEAALPAAAVEAIREEAAQVAEGVTQAATPSVSAETIFAAPKEASEAATPSMDDLVAKVLAKLNPEMLQAVTREILRPVVEAMVKEELKSKKS
jgi:CheY-like chemotaxis protein